MENPVEPLVDIVKRINPKNKILTITKPVRFWGLLENFIKSAFALND